MDNILNQYRERIMESLDEINVERYFHSRIPRKALGELLNLSEAYSIMSRDLNDSEAIMEALSLSNITESLIKENSYRKNHLNEGFENPFDDIEDNTISTRYEEIVDINPDKSMKIGKIKLWNNNTDNKIMYKGGKMVAGQFFGTGDIIETFPVRLIYEKDLYSENIREFAFPIDEPKGIYAIPFGYASFYRNNRTAVQEPNADYEYVDDKGDRYIKIYATRNIRKGNEIILSTDDNDFVNEIKPGQFDYTKREIEPYYSVKNVRIA